MYCTFVFYTTAIVIHIGLYDRLYLNTIVNIVLLLMYFFNKINAYSIKKNVYLCKVVNRSVAFYIKKRKVRTT